MGNKTSASYNSVAEICEKLNENLQSFPTNGCFTLQDFLENSQEISKQLEINEMPLELLDQVANLVQQYKNLKSYDPEKKTLENQIADILKNIPNPNVNETSGADFWLDIYNLLVYDLLSHSKFSTFNKLGENLPTFDHRIQEFPEGITFTQINLALNQILNKNGISINYYNMYQTDEREFCQLLLSSFYPTDHIYTGLTYNLEVINVFSKKARDLILMHVILNNRLDFTGPFRYSENDSHLQLPKSIDESKQFQDIDLFQDVLDVILFTVNMDFENLSFLNQPIYADFIQSNKKHFDDCFQKRLEIEKQKKTTKAIK